MFIEPIQLINSIEQLGQIEKTEKVQQQTGAAEEAGGINIPFKTAFEEAIQDVINTDEQVNIDAEMLATGQSDNLHQYSIDIAKAQLSIDLLVEMRNKALDAYSEIMRMSV